MGAPLVRLEGQVALEIILDRLQNVRLAPGKNDFANIDNFQKRVPNALYLEFNPPRRHEDVLRGHFPA